MPNPIVLPAAEFSPDMPDGAGSTNMIWNVYPRTPVSYGPVNAPMPQYNALPARCQGGAAYRDNIGKVHLFSGTDAALFLLREGLGGWQDVTRASGEYTIDTNEMWNFTYFNGMVIAVNIFDPPQRFILASSTDFENLPGTPPRARYIAVVKNNFVVLANTWDAENGYKPQRVWWSAAGDATSWPLLGTNLAAQLMSGATDLLGTGGAIRGIAADLTNTDAAIFQEHSVRRMDFAGPPSTFSFRAVETARGCLCPNSIVVDGGTAYYWSQGGICAFNGAESLTIGVNKVDKTVYNDFNSSFPDRVVGAGDPSNKLIWWAYPSAQSGDGTPDRLLVYNIELGRFSLCEISCETILRLLSVGYSLDELYTVLGYNLDDVPAPLDSPIWIGGRLTLGMFGVDHRINFLTGTALDATVETTEVQPPPDRRWLVTNSRPIVDGVGTAPSVSIGHRETQQQAVAYTAPVAINAMGQCPVRTSGRYLRAKTNVPAGSQQWDHLSGIELDLTQQGRR